MMPSSPKVFEIPVNLGSGHSQASTARWLPALPGHTRSAQLAPIGPPAQRLVLESLTSALPGTSYLPEAWLGRDVTA